MFIIQRIFQDDFCKLALNLTFENRIFLHNLLQFEFSSHFDLWFAIFMDYHVVHLLQGEKASFNYFPATFYATF